MLIVPIFVASCGGTDDPSAIQSTAPATVADENVTAASAAPVIEQAPVAIPEPCDDARPGSEEDLAVEPQYSATYLKRWTNRRGCPVRLDVLMTRLVAEGACGPEDDILMGTPLGAGHQGESPARMFGATEGAIDRKAQLTPSAKATGYRQGGYELWFDDSDQSALFLVYPDHVERWERASEPLRGCA